ncbi:MAG: ABC transporter ATP-binding protein [Chloroflexota bacterium]|nr:MAG: ABC transporter ATP-binding protein [Chloroflexota bacterium]
MQGTVRVERLTKSYIVRERLGMFKAQKRTVPALKDITFEVSSGEILGLLGPNGAGKTTLIKILATLLLPTSGDAWINGYHILENENDVRASVGCMLMGDRGLYWKLTGRENLEYFGALYRLDPTARRRRAEEIIALLNLGGISERPVESYSSGQKMRLAFGKTLVNDAPLLILDEPTNTLDVPSAAELRSIVRSLNEQGKTIIYTTHIMTEAEMLCDRVAIIDYGRLLAIGTVADLKASLRRDQVTHIRGTIPDQAVTAVRALPMVRQATATTDDGEGVLTVVVGEGQESLSSMIATLHEHGASLKNIDSEELTLEDVFIAKTGRTLSEDTYGKPGR